MYSLHDQLIHCPPPPPQMNHNWKSSAEIAPNCPRCASSNTKFCYYNNYSLSQPRYICKGCRRYWTKGGSLRNVPVGGGCRKNRRVKSARVSNGDRDYKGNLSGFDPNTNSPDSDPMSDPNGSPDIDLAVVFAKFLNNDNNQSTSVESVPADEMNSNSMKSDGSESQHPSDFVRDQSDWSQEMPQLLQGDEIQTPAQEQSIPEFWETDLNALGLQNLLNDEAVQDALWPEDETATAENYDLWQPAAMQMQELGSFSGDHDLLKNFPANLSNDNWSTSFDHTGFEIFSKP